MNNLSMRTRKLSLLAGLTVLAGAANAGLVYDNMTNWENVVAGHTLNATGSTPNTFMGDGYNLLAGTTAITGFDLYPVNLSGTNFTGLRMNIWVWQTVNLGTVNASTPAFSNLLANYVITTGVGAYNTGFVFQHEGVPNGVNPWITLTTPLALTSSQIGLTFNYQGTTDGVNYASFSSLTSAIMAGPTGASTGSNVFNGYYRNANSETNGNFTSTLRSLGLTNQTVGVRVYGDAVPEPTTLAVLGLGAVALLRRRRKA